jgi:hypothetical protein
VTVVVHSSKSTAPSGSTVPSVGNYLLVGPVGRLTLDLPWYTRAPYDLTVESSTLLGYRSTYVKRRLACPRAGCLDGYSPPPHSSPLPQPVLPLTGLTRAQLEASLRYVVSRERWPSARTAHCSSLVHRDADHARIPEPALPRPLPGRRAAADRLLDGAQPGPGRQAPVSRRRLGAARARRLSLLA